MIIEQKRAYRTFMLPTVIFLFVMTVFPLAYSIIISLTNYQIANQEVFKFSGLINYKTTFQDKIFQIALKNTVIIVAVGVISEFLIGSFLAYVFWESISKLKSIIISLIILPIAFAPVAISLMWKYMLNSSYGVVNFCLQKIGFSSIDWIGSRKTALLSLIIVDVWQWTPLIFIIVLAGLESIQKKQIDMVRVDGASWFQMVKLLVIPSLIPFFSLAIILRTIDAFKLFDTVYVITEGGPGSSTETLSLIGYRQGFVFFNTNIAAAESIIILAIITVLTALFIKLIRNIDENYASSF